MPQSNEKKRERYWKNREKERERSRIYRANNWEKERARDIERRRKERAARETTKVERQETAKARSKATWVAKRAVRALDPEWVKKKAAAVVRAREVTKAWRAANRDRQRELERDWAKTPKGRAANQNRKVRKRGRLISELSNLQRGRCAYCRGKLTPASTHVDHIHPRALGGANTRRNYQLACATCNITKSDKDPIFFAQEIGRLL